MNTAMLLQMAAEAGVGRFALTSAGRHYTAAELLAAAGGAAERIRASGCQFVSLLDVSSAATPVALFGAAMAGVPYAPLNYRLPAEQIRALIARLDSLCLIADEDSCAAHRGDPGIGEALTSAQFLEEALAHQAPEPVWPDDPGIAVQLFTSGTTGPPKAAILRHEHLMSYILGSVEFMSAADDEATLVSVPPYHIAGISALLSSIYAARRIVQLADFSASAWLDLVEGEAVTSAFVVPTMLARIVEELEAGSGSRDLRTLRAIAYGGGHMPVSIIERALDLFPAVDFTNAYGLTETSSTITLLGPEDHRQAVASDDAQTRRRLGSVGQALPSVEIEIRDPGGEALAPGQRGEIYVRGPQVSGEYRERSAVDSDGWFPTRDTGHLDADGYLHLGGRADDVIVRGGENISPAEIEAVLLTHPAVVDAAAVAVASEQWGEAVGVAVVLKSGASASVDALQDLVRSQLRSSRVPEAVRFVDELPYNETGKLLRRNIKRWFA
ncbi:MAG: long-chain fatty acid--CoA ligase [Gammaproteobacteria bacterium]|nr:long-chain fatty acid--CoA ligase [Gammaproteobacteria bacterium]